MKWYDSSPAWFLGWCLLCGLLGYFTRELDIPGPILLAVSLTFCAAVTAYCMTDIKRKFPDCNSKIGVSILFTVCALAYAMAEIVL